MKRLKLKPIDAYTITGIGGKGTLETGMVLVDEVRVGEAVIRNVPAVVSDSAPSIDGVLGPTLFGGATLTLDQRKGRLRIGGEPSAVPPPGEDARDGKRPARVVEIPFLSINGTPFIPIRVKGVLMNAMLDTGASQAVLSPHAAGQVPGLEMLEPGMAPPAYREIRGSTGTGRGVSVARRAEVEIAGRTFEMAAHIQDRERILVSYDLTPLSHAFGTEVWAIVGNPQLDEFVMTIDWGEQVLRLSSRK